MGWIKYLRIWLAAKFFLVFTICIAVGCKKSDESGKSDDGASLRLQIDYYPEASHGGLYQAILKDFFQKKGVNNRVEILPGGSGVYPMQRVALGHAEFGIARLDDLLMAIERGLPLKAVIATYQRDPQGLMFHRGQGIYDFKDLDGRKVMARPGAGFITWIEKKYGISFELVPLNYDIAQFLADSTLVQQCYVTSQPYYVRKAGIEVETLLLADTGFDPIRVLYVNTKFSNHNPDLVRHFAEAVLIGIEDYLNGDRSETDELLLKLNPINVPGLNDFTIEQIRKYRLIEGNADSGESLGKIDRARVMETVQIMIEVGMLQKLLSYDEIVDASMLSNIVD
ncbi:MAG: ABC transporter substrate-binding protein [Verrucomicrobiota bacterium]